MPFKTRGQKIAAAKRRFIFINNQISLGDLKLDSSDFKKETSKKSAMGIDDLSYVKREVLAIFLIAGAIIGVQIVLRITPVQIFP